MIEAASLTKSYGSVTAVDKASFLCSDGAITTLLGANGSGKSTTLGCLVGLLKPDSGEMRVDGTRVEGSEMLVRRAIGWFPDAFGLYPRLTGREHIRYFGALHGLSGAALETATARTIETLALGDFVERRAAGYSTGQQMSIALARALVHDPRNIILDEPTRGLDVMGVRQLRSVLRRLREAGRCILMSSHVMAEVADLSDHVVMMSRGRVVASGSPDEVVAEAGAQNLEGALVTLADRS